MTRSAETGEILLRGIASTRREGGTGNRRRWAPIGWTLGWRLIIAFLTLVGILFTPVLFSVLMADGAANGGAGANELGQIVNMLQAMATWQQQQRARLDTLQQAVRTTAQGVPNTSRRPKVLFKKLRNRFRQLCSRISKMHKGRFNRCSKVKC